MNKQFADLLPEIAKPIAKAVAVFVVTWLAAAAAWVAAELGVEITYDPDAVETVITSVLLAAVTYVTQNKS